MYLKNIDKQSVEIYNYTKVISQFNFNGNKYKLKLAGLSEVRMSVYFYRDVQFIKNNMLVISGFMQQPDFYYEPISANKNFAFIPIMGKPLLINLSTGEKLISSVRWLNGNIYNNESTKMIINGVDEFKVVNLLNMSEEYAYKKESIKDAFFINNETIAYFKNGGEIETIHLKTKEKKLNIIESPFQKYNISRKKYQCLMDKQTHCLALPEGGMAYSGILDNWNYVNTKDKLVFKTLVPKSGIKYSEGYDREYCDVSYSYIELKNEDLNT